MSVVEPAVTALALQSIGEVAWLLGVSAGTIRLWESQGLITPARTHAGRRGYSADDLEILRRVQFLRTVHRLNAPAIRQILDSESTKKRRGDGASPPIA